MTARSGADAQYGRTRVALLAWTLVALAAILGLTVSNLMLAKFGVNYEGAGGAAWQKIHPSSYVALLAIAVLALSNGNPLDLLDDVLRRHPGAIWFMAGVLVLFAYIVVRIQGPVTQLIDSFVAPWILFIGLLRLPPSWLERMALGLHAFMAMNAVLGIAEFATGFRLTPLVAEGVELTGDWRSTALLGHPLLNAAAAASYAFMLVNGGSRDLPGWAAAAALALQIVAMAAFGGRAATLVFFLFAGPALVALIWRRRGTYAMTPAAAGLLAIVLVAGLLAITGLAAGGFFDRFAARFLEDQGSAVARQSMFDLLWRLPADALWFGSDPELIATLQRLEGIPFGIESFWIAMIANYGLLMSIPFFLVFLLFMNEYRRALIPGTGWSVLLFLLVISGSTSLASKTAMLTFFTIAACLLLRWPAGRARS